LPQTEAASIAPDLRQNLPICDQERGAEYRSVDMKRKLSVVDILRKRIEKWRDEDPSSLLTKRIEQATAPLQWLVAMLLPDRLIQEAVEKTLWASEVLTDADNGAADLTIEQADAEADAVHNWAMGAAAALGAWDLAGPLGIAPSLASLFTLSFRTIKKIGLCFGFDTSSPAEEMIVLEIFLAANAFYHRDKIDALRAIEEMPTVATHEDVLALSSKLSKTISQNLTRRRSLASIPAMGALVGGSANVWLLRDVGWAARNVFAMRRLQKAHAQGAGELPKAA
jgi:hypothetical protein